MSLAVSKSKFPVLFDVKCCMQSCRVESLYSLLSCSMHIISYHNIQFFSKLESFEVKKYSGINSLFPYCSALMQQIMPSFYVFSWYTNAVK